MSASLVGSEMCIRDSVYSSNKAEIRAAAAKFRGEALQVPAATLLDEWAGARKNDPWADARLLGIFEAFG
eukprot:7590538-Alexandrium_andersonii.AAC.1